MYLLRRRPSQFYLLQGFLVIIAFLGLTAVGIQAADPPAKLEGYDFTFPAMGSSVTFSAYAESEKQVTDAFEAARLEVERLAAIMTDYDPQSELSRLHECPVTTNPLDSRSLEALLSAPSKITSVLPLGRGSDPGSGSRGGAEP